MEQKVIKINFPLGIPGFESYKDWDFIPEQDTPLAQLVCADNEYIGFVLTRPENYFPVYLKDIELDVEARKVLEVKENTKLEVWGILCLADDLKQTTINLKAPIIFNLETQKGYQLILNEDKYSSRELLFAQQNQATAEEGGKE
ncbi:MAG: flagellar assembly protein FliW [Peptococcaceae bacterium]|nr:flagellar assembly protein FliW [Peptococcaceae bacterium]